jgi:vesicle coat complex subunit
VRATLVTWPSFADVQLVNQTPNTLQNLCLDFVTLGDLKLVERPNRIKSRNGRAFPLQIVLLVDH